MGNLIFQAINNFCKILLYRKINLIIYIKIKIISFTIASGYYSYSDP